MENALEMLLAAREIVSDPKRWTRGEMARDALDRPSRLEDGVRFCSVGAVRKARIDVIRRGNRREPLDAAERVRLFSSTMDSCKFAICLLTQKSVKVNGVEIIEANDMLGHEAVLKAFDSAIEELSSKTRE